MPNSFCFKKLLCQSSVAAKFSSPFLKESSPQMNVCLEFHVGSRPPSVVEGGVVFHGELVPPEVVHATANGLILPPKHLNFTFFKSRAEMIVTSTCIRFAIAFLMVTDGEPSKALC